MNDPARAALIIRGLVQGVFYRAFTREVAQRHGLTGWVSNLPDGSVAAVFEGERGGIERAIAECREGPHAGRVDTIDIAWEQYRGEFGSFSIRYS